MVVGWWTRHYLYMLLLLLIPNMLQGVSTEAERLPSINQDHHHFASAAVHRLPVARQRSPGKSAASLLFAPAIVTVPVRSGFTAISENSDINPLPAEAEATDVTVINGFLRDQVRRLRTALRQHQQVIRCSSFFLFFLNIAYHACSRSSSRC